VSLIGAARGLWQRSQSATSAMQIQVPLVRSADQRCVCIDRHVGDWRRAFAVRTSEYAGELVTDGDMRCAAVWVVPSESHPLRCADRQRNQAGTWVRGHK
jgi:hypothetical protein